MPGAVLKGSALTFALYFLSTALPVIGLPAGVLLPFPCIYYSIKFGRKAGYVIVALMLSVLAVVDRSGMLLYLLQSVTCSLLLPEFLLRGKTGSRAILYSVAITAAIIALFAVIYAYFFTADIDGQVGKVLHAAISQMGETYRQSGMSGDDQKVLGGALAETEAIFVKIYPALILISLGIGSVCNLLLLRRLSGSLGKELSLGRFSDYRNPDLLVWLLILPGFALLAENDIVSRAAMNIMAVTIFLYLVQGTAIVTWFSRKLAIPRFVTILFYALLLLQPIFTAAVAAFGLFDLWADFRAPKKTTNL